MKLSERARSILNNFSTINQSIYIPAGNVIATVATGNNILGRAEVDDVFPKDIAIYDLSRFLGAINLLNDPELDFEDDGVVKLISGNTTIRYAFADESLIHKAPTEKPPLEDPFFEDKITSADLTQIMKAASVMKMEDITIKGDGSTVWVIAHNADNPSADQYKVELGKSDEKFNVHLKTNNVKVHSGVDYRIGLYQIKSGAIIIGFTSLGDGDLQYMISSETDSTMGE